MNRYKPDKIDSRHASRVAQSAIDIKGGYQEFYQRSAQKLMAITLLYIDYNKANTEEVLAIFPDSIDQTRDLKRFLRLIQLTNSKELIDKFELDFEPTKRDEETHRFINEACNLLADLPDAALFSAADEVIRYFSKVRQADGQTIEHDHSIIDKLIREAVK